jgi:hypothetical protein
VDNASVTAPLERTTARTDALALAGLLALAVVLVGLYATTFTQFSPVDELQHADYVIKASHGQLLRRGDRTGQEALGEATCRGLVVPEPPRADNCRTTGDRPPVVEQQSGVNSEEIQPPLYYFVTGALARAGRRVTGASSIVTTARLVGALWLAGGVVVLWALLGLLGVRPSARWAVVALVVSAPTVLDASALVNNDATALLAGGGVLLAAVAWEQRRLHGAAVLGAVVVAVALKPTNVFGVGVAALYLLWRAVSTDAGDRPRPWRSQAGMAAAVVVAAVVAGLGLLVLHDAVARAGPLSNPNTAHFQVDHLALGQVLGAVPAGVVPVQDPFLPDFLDTSVMKLLVRCGEWLLLGGAVGTAATSARGSAGEALAVSALAGCAVTGPALVVLNYLSLQTYVAIPSRYALSVVPALAAALALALGKSWTPFAVATVAALSSAVILVALVTA